MTGKRRVKGGDLKCQSESDGEMQSKDPKKGAKTQKERGLKCQSKIMKRNVIGHGP